MITEKSENSAFENTEAAKVASKTTMSASEKDPDAVFQQFEAAEEQDGCRIDKLLSLIYTDQSRSFFQKLIKNGKVTVNSQPVSKNSFCVRAGDLVAVSIPKAASVRIEPENIPLDILYEDDDILIVNKPKGMVVHPAAGHYSGTLVNAVLYHCKDSLSGINGEIRPGIVHRIDKDTTGSLIICKNDFAHSCIAGQIEEHSVKREYVGIVIGNIKEDMGTIDTWIARNPTDRKKMAVSPKGTGKQAVTHYRVLERFHGFTYVRFQLETGRTHQIRVHMASISRPLLGDTLYGPGADKQPVRHLQGQTLHAETIGFVHPRTGNYMEFHAPLPEYFEDLLVKVRKMT